MHLQYLISKVSRRLESPHAVTQLESIRLTLGTDVGSFLSGVFFNYCLFFCSCSKQYLAFNSGYNFKTSPFNQVTCIKVEWLYFAQHEARVCVSRWDLMFVSGYIPSLGRLQQSQTQRTTDIIHTASALAVLTFTTALSSKTLSKAKFCYTVLLHFSQGHAEGSSATAWQS